MRFNQNVMKVSGRGKTGLDLELVLEEYNRKLGNKLSTGDCPGHAGQGPGNGVPCRVCGGVV